MAVLQAHRPHMDDSVDYNAPSSNVQDEDMTSNVDQDFESVGQKRGRGEVDQRMQVHGGGSKRQAVSMPVQLRLLCPQIRSGCVIGKGGEVIQQLRQETGAKIKVEPMIAGCDERVVSISSPDAPETEATPAQNALFRVLDCIIEGESRDNDANGQTTARLLVAGGQIGCILGKGGCIVSEMRKSTGARIKILSPKERPPVAADGDELINISGDIARVKAAMEIIAAKLRANPARNNTQPRSISITANASYGLLPGPVINGMNGNGLMGGPEANTQLQHLLLQGRGSPVPTTPVEITFWLLVPPGQVGMVIGRGGEVIKRIRNETDARVKVHTGAEGEDRVVHITAIEDERNAGAAQEAMLRCCTCLAPDSAAPCGLRVVVPSPQIGAVLGKGGKTIAALRAETNVSVRVIPWEGHRPERLQELDCGLEILQIEGRQGLALAALRAASSLLRQWQVRNQLPANGDVFSNGVGGMGMQDRPSLQGGLGGMQSLGGLSSLAALLGLGNQRSGSPLNSSPLHMGPHAHGPPVLSRAGRERDGGLAHHMVIEASQVGMVLGQGGANISQIRQISGARVKLRDERLEGGKRELELFGSPDQVQAAQNIVQAFLLTGHQQVNNSHQGRNHR